jgi:hypothetical protein
MSIWIGNIPMGGSVCHTEVAPHPQGVSDPRSVLVKHGCWQQSHQMGKASRKVAC